MLQGVPQPQASSVLALHGRLHVCAQATMSLCTSHDHSYEHMPDRDATSKKVCM